MTQIRLNAEGLSQASSTLRSQGNELEGLITQMQNVINALPDSWEGAAANRICRAVCRTKARTR